MLLLIRRAVSVALKTGVEVANVEEKSDIVVFGDVVDQ